MPNTAVASRRCIVELNPSLFLMLGVCSEKDLAQQTLTLPSEEGTFYRAKSTPRWVLYRASVKGHGERNAQGGRHTLDPEQR